MTSNLSTASTGSYVMLHADNINLQSSLQKRLYQYCVSVMLYWWCYVMLVAEDGLQDKW